MKSSKFTLYALIIALFAILSLSACGGEQTNANLKYLPASEVLEVGNVLYCSGWMDLKVTKILESSLEGKADCLISDNETTVKGDTVNFTTTGTLESISHLTGKQYGYGVITNDKGELVQIYDQNNRGNVYIFWPPPAGNE